MAATCQASAADARRNRQATSRFHAAESNNDAPRFTPVKASNGSLNDVRTLQREVACRCSTDFGQFKDSILSAGVKPNGPRPGLMAARGRSTYDEKLRVSGPRRMIYADAMRAIGRPFITTHQYAFRDGLDFD